MNLTNFPYDLYLNISSFLNKKDMYGFIYSCKKTSSLLLWCNDDAGVHICLGCDLTCSMNSVYQNLKHYLLELLQDLNTKKNNERTLFSSFFYWDLDRANYEQEPYVQIQPPAESIIKQERLISNANIASGGGPECGGISLCELDTQFKNRWISQHTGDFGKTMDIIVLCLDAPFHFLVDTESYYEVSRKHSIRHDWLAAIHNLCKKGVLIILVCINTQPNFKSALRLMGGMIDALGGFALEIDPSNLKDIPLFIKTIIDEELQKRKIVHETYKSIAYKYRYMNNDQLSKIMENELEANNTEIKCINIPSQNRIYANDVPNSRELAQCKNIKEAVDKGLMESEAVMKRLCYNNGGINIACKESLPIFTHDPVENFDFVDNDDGLPPLQPIMSRQQSVCITAPVVPSILPMKRSNAIADISNMVAYSTPDPVSRQLTLDKIVDGDSLQSFGICRQKSISRDFQPKNSLKLNGRRHSTIMNLTLSTINEEEPKPTCIIEGSIKCYLREPIVDLGHITDPLLSLVNKNNEEKFRILLKEQNPKQYELYMNGGVLNRYKPASLSPDPVDNESIQINIDEDGMINDLMPTMCRSFSESHDSNHRILRFIKSSSTY